MDCPSVHSLYLSIQLNGHGIRNENALHNSSSQFRKSRIASVSVVLWTEEKGNLKNDGVTESHL